MNDFNRHQMLAALVGLVTALFVMGGLPGRWRRQLRMAAIVFFFIAVAVALVQIGLWLAEPGH
jgi:cell division protein FtsW (lipid II flippase)